MLKYIIVVFLALLLTSCSPEKDSSERVQSLGNELYLNQNNKICYVNEKGGEATDFEASVSPAEITEDDFVILADGTVRAPLSFDSFKDYAELSYMQKHMSWEDWVYGKNEDGILIELKKDETVLKDIEITVDDDIYANVKDGEITDYLIVSGDGSYIEINSQTVEKYGSLSKNGEIYSGIYRSDSNTLYLAPATAFKSWVDTANEISKTDKIADVKMHKYDGDGRFDGDSPVYVLTESKKLYTIQYGEIISEEENVSDIFFTGTMLTVKISAEGKVLYSNSDAMKDWSNVKKVACVDFANDDFAGLTTDGKIILTENSSIPKEALEWEKITDFICLGDSQNYYLIGLKSDGTLLTTSNNSDKYKETYLAWSDIKEFDLTDSITALTNKGKILTVPIE